jgi:ribosomal protein S25
MYIKRLWYFIPVLLIIIGIGLYFWQPWQTRQQLVDLNNAGEIVKACQQASEDIKNYRYKTDLSVGKQISVSVNNRVIREQTNRQMVNFSWDIPKMSGMATMYAEGQKVYVFHPLKNKWILPNEEPTISPFMDFFWGQLGLIDPVENILKLDPLGKNISTYMEGTDEGADSVAIQVIPDANALSEINKSFPPQFATGELTDVKLYYWISKKDFLVTRYEIRASVAFFGIKTMNFLTVSTPFDYDKTRINIPKLLQDKMKLK